MEQIQFISLKFAMCGNTPPPPIILLGLEVHVIDIQNAHAQHSHNSNIRQNNR